MSCGMDCSLGIRPECYGITESCGISIPNFLGNCHIYFQSGYISLHSHQQWRSVPLVPRALHHKSVNGNFDLSHSDRGKIKFHCFFFYCISLMAKDLNISLTISQPFDTPLLGNLCADLYFIFKLDCLFY